MSALKSVQRQLESLADPVIAAHSQRFFKTGPGQYGEGDRFRGIRVPALRELAREFRDLSYEDVVVDLLHSPFHEDRLTALLIWVLQFEAGDPERRMRIYSGYMANRDRINNWDLVDLSAPNIVGAHLENRKKQPLTNLARSSALWDRRIAVMATFYYIQRGIFADTLRIARKLLHEREELIQKAVGWMLREIGKRDQDVEEAFLRRYHRDMPRPMLRYAIERFPEEKRRAYIVGAI